MPFLKTLFTSLIIFSISIALLEYVGQNYLLKDKLYIVDNPDHRMKPGSKPDINSDGIRSMVEANQFRPEDHNIIFLGDSFVFGFDVDYQDTIPQQLESKIRENAGDKIVNVANFGWISSSPLLSYRLLKDIGEKYHPDAIILAIDMTDFHDDVKMDHAITRQGVFSLLDYTPISLLIVKKILGKFFPEAHERLLDLPAGRFFIADRPLSESRKYLSHIQSNIQAIAEYSEKQLGAKFMLLAFPRYFQYNTDESPNNWEKHEYAHLGPYVQEPFKFISELKQSSTFPVHSLLPTFQETTVFPTVFDDDPHWNVVGNGIAMEAIYEFTKSEGLIDIVQQP